jgi:hypothetical protein
MGDDLLPEICQELFCNFRALLLGYGVTYKHKTKEKTIFKKTWEPLMVEIKNFFIKFPFTRPPKTSSPSKFCNL